MEFANNKTSRRAFYSYENYRGHEKKTAGITKIRLIKPVNEERYLGRYDR